MKKKKLSKLEKWEKRQERNRKAPYNFTPIYDPRPNGTKKK